MRRFFSVIAALGLICAMGARGGTFAPISHSMSFDIGALGIDYRAVEGCDGTFAFLSYDGFTGNSAEGEALLPVKYLTFSVPTAARNIALTVDAGPAHTVATLHPVYPVQPSRLMSDTSAVVVTTDVARSSNTLCEIVDDGFLFGEHHLVTVKVSPMTYDATTGRLALHESLSFTLDFPDTATGRRNAMAVNKRYIAATSPTRRAEDMAIVSRLVVNPGQIETNLPAIDNTVIRKGMALSQLPVYEYCVVTSRELAPAFERLVTWKQTKGYTAGVVCIEDILADPAFADGDPISTGINDDAAKLRAYLYYAYSQPDGTRYALLGGDHTNMPIRKGSILKDKPFYQGQIINGLSSDLYFSDLTSNWNKNNDGVFGAENYVDYYPEIMVGRILCRSAVEVRNYTYKLLLYERNPGNGNYRYLNNALSTISNDLKSWYTDDVVSSHLKQIFNLYLDEIHEGTTGNEYFPKGVDIINLMNKKYYGFVSWHSHGSPEGVCVNDHLRKYGKTWGISSLDDVRVSFQDEVGNGLDNLSNHDKPFVSYSMSCTTMPFEDDDNVPVNFGRSLTTWGLYGSCAYMGNTLAGWKPEGFKLENAFLDLAATNEYSLGTAEALSKACAHYDVKHWSKLVHNLLGCPEFHMWKTIKGKFRDCQILYLDNGIRFIDLPSEPITVALKSCNGDIKRFDSDLYNFHFLPGSPNSAITLYGKQRVPYTFAIFQNETVRTDNYFIVDEISMGKAVATTRTAGEFIVSSAKLKIEATGDVLIDDGFVATSGAEIIITSKKCVKITGGEITGGSTLIVTAPLIEVSKDFSVSSDSKFELNFKTNDNE